MIAWFLSMALAFADPLEDLTIASNPELSEEVRQKAFTNLVQTGATNMSYVLSISQDEAAPIRQRWVAIRALGAIKGDQAEQVLLKLSSDSHPAIRAASVSALGDLGLDDNTGMVMVRLKDDAIIVRVAAAEALGKLKDPKAIQSLKKSLEDQSNYYRGASLWVRTHYVTALGNIGTPEVYPVLLTCLKDEDERVVKEAVAVLEKMTQFSLADGRSWEQEIEAWERWLGNQLK